MNMDRIIAHLGLFWRSESIIADIHLRHVAARTLLTAVALLAAGLGITALSVAAYLALEPYLGPAQAATVLGGFHILVSAIAIFFVGRAHKNRDLDLAKEVRELSLSALSDDCKELQSEIGSIVRLVRHPFEGALPGIIAPLIAIILKAIKKPDASGDA